MENQIKETEETKLLKVIEGNKLLAEIDADGIFINTKEVKNTINQLSRLLRYLSAVSEV